MTLEELHQELLRLAEEQLRFAGTRPWKAISLGTARGFDRAAKLVQQLQDTQAKRIAELEAFLYSFRRCFQRDSGYSDLYEQADNLLNLGLYADEDDLDD